MLELLLSETLDLGSEGLRRISLSISIDVNTKFCGTQYCSKRLPVGIYIELPIYHIPRPYDPRHYDAHIISRNEI